jgi:subtilisin family serine protease
MTVSPRGSIQKTLLGTASSFTGRRQAACRRNYWFWNQDRDVSIVFWFFTQSSVNLYHSSIDTGVDYTHPQLGGGIGPGFKIVGGYDFVGPDYDGTNKPIPNPDPLDKCNGLCLSPSYNFGFPYICTGHGTHVAV